MVKALILAFLSLIGLGLGSCTSEADNKVVAEDTVASDKAQIVPQALPRPVRPLNRRDILLAAFEAASAVASRLAGGDQREMEGRRFEFRLRFGCEAPHAKLAPDQTGWSYDVATRTLRVQAVPDIDLADPIVATVAGDGIEAAEGIWVKRPWVLEASCPTSSNATPNNEMWRVALVQYFMPSEPRIERRSNRPYLAVKRLAQGEEPPKGGFDLVLTGRLEATEAKEIIQCVETSQAQPPACLINIQLERVAIERADNTEMLAYWERG